MNQPNSNKDIRERALPVLTHIFSDVLRRLDDTSDSVRLLALDVVSVVPVCLDRDHLEEPDVRVFLDHTYAMLLLHADDNEEDVRKKCIGESKSNIRTWG
jgi:hypothetical protein